MENKKIDYIFKDICLTVGGDGSSKLYTVTNIHTGKTQVVVEKSISIRMPIQKYEEAMQIYERLNGSGRVISIEDLLKIRGFEFPKGEK